jgi:hypothetical protein
VHGNRLFHFFSYDSDDEFCRIELMRAWGGKLIAKRAAGLMIQSFVAHGATVCRFIKKNHIFQGSYAMWGQFAVYIADNGPSKVHRSCKTKSYF